jgi:hypothetical protein
VAYYSSYRFKIALFPGKYNSNQNRRDKFHILFSFGQVKLWIITKPILSKTFLLLPDKNGIAGGGKSAFRGSLAGKTQAVPPSGGVWTCPPAG